MAAKTVTATGLALGCVCILSACSMVTVADPVIAGRKYVNEAVPLGPVSMRVHAEGPAVPSAFSSWMPFGDDGKPAPERVNLSLGFLSSREATNVVVRSGTLKAARTGQVAEVQERFRADGSKEGCGAQTTEPLNLDYWFNDHVNPDAWTCVTLGFRMPGHQAGDRLELTLEPINVSGNIVRVLPIIFEPQD